MSQVLNQLYYLFGHFRNPDFTNISDAYHSEPKKYMISQRKPITFLLKKVGDNIFALDSDKGIFKYEYTVLMDLGKIVERSLTMTPEAFRATFLKQDHEEYLKNGPYTLDEDYHRFMKLNNDICMRSQIDCAAYDPVTGKPFVFELKTRAACPIRYDLPNYKDYLDYEINAYRGLHSSFEREYYDLSLALSSPRRVHEVLLLTENWPNGRGLYRLP